MFRSGQLIPSWTGSRLDQPLTGRGPDKPAALMAATNSPSKRRPERLPSIPD